MFGWSSSQGAIFRIGTGTLRPSMRSSRSSSPVRVHMLSMTDYVDSPRCFSPTSSIQRLDRPRLAIAHGRTSGFARHDHSPGTREISGQRIKTMGDGFLATSTAPRERSDAHARSSTRSISRDRAPGRTAHRRDNARRRRHLWYRGGHRSEDWGEGRASEVFVSSTVKDLVAD